MGFIGAQEIILVAPIALTAIAILRAKKAAKKAIESVNKCDCGGAPKLYIKKVTFWIYGSLITFLASLFFDIPRDYLALSYLAINGSAPALYIIRLKLAVANAIKRQGEWVICSRCNKPLTEQKERG